MASLASGPPWMTSSPTRRGFFPDDLDNFTAPPTHRGFSPATPPHLPHQGGAEAGRGRRGQGLVKLLNELYQQLLFRKSS
uniref:Uncharacterized protein n=1 Tax=Oryza glumipatula TaxID=40148 RepID=A0A0D9YF12_9ORYZ